MGKRAVIVAGMVGGALWGIAVLWLGLRSTSWDGSEPLSALPLAVLPGGLVLAANIGRLAQRRFFDDRIIDGAAFAEGSPAEIDQRVLTNMTEQSVLALMLWPALALALGEQGAGTVLALGWAFALTRVLFWVGYHVSPPLRGFGFAGSFYPTVMAGLWAVWLWIDPVTR